MLLEMAGDCMARVPIYVSGARTKATLIGFY